MADKKVKMFLSGNEAIARGVLEAGVKVAAAYPGTPSTEILETINHFGKETGMHSEWSTNEKVAFEVALGAAWSGLRAFTAAKHVGLNVAADPFFTAALFGGMQGGMVMCIANDCRSDWQFSRSGHLDERSYRCINAEHYSSSQLFRFLDLQFLSSKSIYG